MPLRAKRACAKVEAIPHRRNAGFGSPFASAVQAPSNRPRPTLLIMKAFALFTLLGACALPLHAEIIFGNLAAYTNDSGAVTSIVGSSGSGKAAGFTMGNVGYEVTSISLRFSAIGNDSFDVPKISIWSNVSDRPGVQIGDAFANPAFTTPGSNATYTFTPASAITLAANISYFIVVQPGSSTASFNWLNGSPTVAPTGVASTGITRYGSSPNPQDYTGASGNFNWFQIEGTSLIPEPSTYTALLGVGSLGFVLLRRRRT